MNTYQFDVPIQAPPARVWKALVEEIDEWWLDDFRMTGPDAIVALEAFAGGRLWEQSAAGSLMWYQVQMIQVPDRMIYLVGFLAPDFGGPATSHVKLVVTPSGSQSVLTFSDSLLGNASGQQLEESWKQLFTDGLKPFVEADFAESSG